MIDCKIQIEDGEIVNIYNTYRFAFLDSDHRLEAPMREFDSTSYAEENGIHVDPRTTLDSFDYKVKFLVEADHSTKATFLDSVNNCIRKFNYDTHKITAISDIIQVKQISLWNTRDNVKIVGYPVMISEVEDLYYSKKYGKLDFAVVELTIKVDKPQLCDFHAT